MTTTRRKFLSTVSAVTAGGLAALSSRAPRFLLESAAFGAETKGEKILVVAQLIVRLDERDDDAGGARLEIMTRADVNTAPSGEQLGFAHVAIAVGADSAVDDLAARMRADGFGILSGPRRTGDGYYECVVLDPEGNRVEIAAD